MSISINNLTAQQISEIQAKSNAGETLTAEEKDVLFQLSQNDGLDTFSSTTPATAVTNNSGSGGQKNQVTFLIYSGPSCGRCKTMDKLLENGVKDAIGDSATFGSMTLEEMRAYKKQCGYKGSSVGFPVIVKLVNGEPVEFNCYGNGLEKVYNKADKLEAWFRSEIEESNGGAPASSGAGAASGASSTADTSGAAAASGASSASSTSSAKTVGSTQQLSSIGQSLGLTLKGVDLAEDLDDITAYSESLKAMLTQVEAVIAQKTKELERLQAEQDELKADEAAQQKRLEDLEAEYATKQARMQDVSDEIDSTNSANAAAQAQYQSDYDTAYAAAMAQYNPETDGDQQEYLKEKLKGLTEPSASDTSSLQDEYESLQSNCSSLSQSIDVIKNQTLPNVQHKLRNIETQITTTQTALNAANNDKTAITTEQSGINKLACDTIKSYVSSEEWALVSKYNIDLMASRADGTPKYMLAKGKSDGKYHIYERDDQDCSAVTLARKYAPNKGFDIVPSGNGYLRNFSPTDAPCADKVVHFRMNPCEDQACWCSEKADYCTCSPLAFDMDNNGIKTTTSKIMYDIDGDGTLDEINNVTEGILAFDKDGDGVIGSNGSELFGNNTDLDGDGKADGYKDGFEALKAMAFKENLINGADDMVLDENDLKALEEKYGLSMKVGGYDGELKSLADLGITQINLASTTETSTTDNFDGQHNQLMTQEGATFVQNGETKDYVDVWNAVKKKP